MSSLTRPWRRTRRRAVALLALLVLVWAAGSHRFVSAHVFISDTAKQTGAVLHVVPADDPVAGEYTGLAFEIQNQRDISNWAAQLKITGPDQPAYFVPATIKVRTVVSGLYFRTPGSYRLELRIVPKDDSAAAINFDYTLGVRAGANAAASGTRPVWPTVVLLAAIWALGALLLLFVQNRREIYRNRL